MSFKTWLIDFLGRAKNTETGEEYLSDGGLPSEDNIAPRLLAIASAVNLVAKTIGECEFRTIRKGVPYKGDEYYLWNVKPNKNQQSSEFLQKLVWQYFCNPNGVLIFELERSGDLLVADTFTETPYAAYDSRYDGITVGDFTLSRPLFASEVIRLRNNNQQAMRYINGVYTDFARLLTGAKESFYMQGGEHGVLNISALARNGKTFKEDYEKVVNRWFKNYARRRNAALPLFEGYEYKKDTTTYAGSSKSDDYSKILDSVFDVAARTIGIPPVLLKGQVADSSKARADFLSFCIDPLATQIEEEINAKRYQKTDYLNDTKMIVDTSNCLHVDLIDNASSIDKLIASGVFSVNDVLTILNLPTIPDDWASEHYITKNYEKVKGGERNATNQTASA